MECSSKILRLRFISTKLHELWSKIVLICGLSSKRSSPFNLLRKQLRLVQITIVTRIWILSFSNLKQLFILIELFENRRIFFAACIIFFQSLADSFTKISIMLDGEMILLFYRAAERMLHCVTIQKIDGPVDTKPRGTLSTNFHAKIGLIVIKMRNLLPKEVRNVPG